MGNWYSKEVERIELDPSLLKEMVRGESSSPVESFTFIVDNKVTETPVKHSTSSKFAYSPPVPRSASKFEYSSLLSNGEQNGGLNRFMARNGGRGDEKDREVVRSSVEFNSPSIVSVGGHSFVHSAILAYSEHVHLVIRPDDVWLALITQFSFYVKANAEALRSKFVSFQGKKQLEVKTVGNLHTAPYEQLAFMITDQITANLKLPSLRRWVLPDFSTTTSTDRVVGAFALIATLKKFFDCKFRISCGLPKVTILGSVDDWVQIRQRAERFVEFDTEHNYMRQWVDMLLPVLDHFVRSAEGKPDTEWWNRIANHVGGGSGPTWISGWISVFTVFSSEGEWMGGQKKVTGYISGEHTTDWALVDTVDIPHGYASCPLKIDDNGKEYDTEIFAGHIVSKLINNNATIVPQLDWCILIKDQ